MEHCYKERLEARTRLDSWFEIEDYDTDVEVYQCSSIIIYP